MAEAERVVPEDVVDEILVRLPVKSIIRFESVCKGWQSKSHSSSFKEFYQQQIGKREKKISSETKVHTIKLNDIYNMASPLWIDEIIYNQNILRELDGAGPCVYKALVTDCPHLVGRRTIRAIGPLSNGIYCLTSVVRSFGCGREDVSSVRIALCNPSIRHLKFLPPFPPQFASLLNQISFDFDGRIFTGFGSDNSVVAIINYKFKNKYRNCFLGFVHTSEKGWERIIDYVPHIRIKGPSNATVAFEGGTSNIMNLIDSMEVCPRSFLKGCWHWQMLSGGVYRILSFNFADQSFDVIALPPALEADRRLAIEITVLHDHLALICWRGVHGRYLEFDVWMMMDYGVKESWTKIFNIHPNYESPLNLYSLYGIDYSVLQVDVGDQSESGGIRIERLFFTGRGNAGKVISFDRHGIPEVSSTLHHNFEVDVSFSTRGISAYMESLERP